MALTPNPSGTYVPATPGDVAHQADHDEINPMLQPVLDAPSGSMFKRVAGGLLEALATTALGRSLLNQPTTAALQTVADVDSRSGVTTKANAARDAAITSANAYTDAEVTAAVKAGAVNPRGNWDAAVAYDTLDLVFHAATGDSWYAKEPTAAGEEPNVSAKWNRYAEGLNKATADAAYVPAFVVSAAFGGGTTDATAHIQSKIDACELAGGGTVLVPVGEYRITGTITIDEPSVALIGAGGITYREAGFGTDHWKGSRLLFAGAGAGIDAAPLGGTNNQGGVIIERLGFWDEVANTNTLLKIRAQTDWAVRDCTFGNALVGVEIDAEVSVFGFGGDASWGDISHCIFVDNATGLKIVDGSGPPDWKVWNSKFYENTIGIDVATNSIGWEVHGTKFDMEADEIGMWVRDGARGKVLGCFFEGTTATTTTGIKVGDTGTDVLALAVIGTTFDGGNFGIDIVNAVGVQVQSVTWNSVTTGVRIGASASYCTVSGGYAQFVTTLLDVNTASAGSNTLFPMPGVNTVTTLVNDPGSKVKLQERFGNVWLGEEATLKFGTRSGAKFGTGQRLDWGTAPPTTGTWSRGDVRFNSAAASGAPAGWMCDVGGTPGTWKAMANLAA